MLCEKTYEKPGGLRHSATRIGSFGAKVSGIGLAPNGTHFKTFVAILGLRIKRIRQRIRARG